MTHHTPPPVITRSEEHGVQLHILLKRGSTKLRTYIFNQLINAYTPPGGTVENLLCLPHVKTTLEKANKYKFSKQQLDILYPTAPHIFDAKKIDITLACLIFRNLLKPPNDFRWDSMPLTTDTRDYAKVTRVRLLRNEIMHKTLEISTADFKMLWSTLMFALGEIGYDPMEAKELGTGVIDREVYLELISVKEKLRKERERKIDSVRWNIPEENTKFKGRDKEIDLLHQQFKKIREENVIAGVVLSGEGGVGKTTLGLEYIKQCSDYFDNNIIWIDAEHNVSLNASFSELCRYLNIEAYGSTFAPLVYEYFSDRNCLFIFDNAISFNEISTFLPTTAMSCKPSILITSQSQKWENDFTVIKISPFTKETAVELVRSELPSIEIAEKLVEKLEYFPRAIEQAITFIRESKITIDEYLTIYETQFDKVFEDLSDIKTTWSLILEKLKEDEHMRNIIQICSLLEGRDISRRLLLTIYHRNGNNEPDVIQALNEIISYNLLTHGTNGTEVTYKMPSWTQKAIKLSLNDDHDVVVDRALHMITNAMNSNDFGQYHYQYGDNWLHHIPYIFSECKSHVLISNAICLLPKVFQACSNKSLLQNALIILHKLSENINLLSDRDTAHSLNLKLEPYYYFCYVKLECYEDITTLFKQLHLDIGKLIEDGNLPRVANEETYKTLLQMIQREDKVLSEDERYFCRWVLFLLFIEYFKNTEVRVERFIEQFMRVQKDYDKLTLLDFGTFLTFVLVNQKKYGDLTELYRTLHDTSKDILGEEHKQMLNIEWQMAYALKKQRKYEDSIEIYERICEINRVTLGEGHQDTINARLRTANVFEMQNKYDEAIAIYNNIYDIRKSYLGEYDLDTIQVKRKVADVLWQQKKYDESLKVLDTVYETKQSVLGEEHGDNIKIGLAMANVLVSQKKYGDAIELYRKLYQTQKENLGETDDTVLSIEWKIATTLKNQQQYNKAIDLYEKIYAIKVSKFGEQHNDTLNVRLHIAYTLESQQKYRDAFNIYKELYDIRRTTLGETHDDTLQMKWKEGDVLKLQRKYYDALKCFEEVYETKKRVLGENDPDTMECQMKIAHVLELQKKYESAVNIYQNLYKMKEESLGERHDDVLMIQWKIATVLKNQKEYDKSIELYEKIYSIKVSKFGESHKDAVNAKLHIAYVFESQQKYEDAIDIYNMLHDVRRSTLGVNHLDTIQMKWKVADVLRKQKKYDESVQLFQAVHKMKENILGKQHKDTLEIQVNIANVLLSKREYKEALGLYNNIYQIKRMVLGEKHNDVLRIKRKVDEAREKNY